MAELTMDQLYATYTDEAAAKEATAYRTIPKGLYTLKGDKTTPQIGEKADFESLFGRQYATLSGTVTGPKGESVRVTFDVSWQVYRFNALTRKAEAITDENRDRAASGEWALDKPSKLWGQLTTAYDSVKKPVQESLEMFKMYPINVFLTESFETPEGWRSPRDEATKLEYIKQGYSRKNFVTSLSKIK